MTEDAYLPAISSNTSLAVEATPLKGIIGVPLAGAEGEDEVAGLFVGAFLRFTAETLPFFSCGGGADYAVAAEPGARAFPAGPAGFPPRTMTLPCRLRAGTTLA